MDILLMTLGFTESKVDSNICFKVEDEILYRMTSSHMGARRTFEKVQDRGSWYPMILDGYIEY